MTCQAKDPELFFPVGTGRPALLKLGETKRVCAGCPVQSLCLEWAMLGRIDYGVWGGLSECERRTLKRRNSRADLAARTRS